MRGQHKVKLSTDEESLPFGDNPFDSLDSADLLKALPEPAVSSKANTTGESFRKERIEIRLEKAGRGGKTVTTLRGFSTNIPVATLEAMALDLKKTCACGGTLKDRIIELQGNVCARVRNVLNARGCTVVGFRK